MGELNKAALQAATGAFMDRLTDKPTTGDLLAALRFALEAYESVRVAPAPASQHYSDLLELFRLTLGKLALHDWEAADEIRCQYRAHEAELTSRAQRTDNPS